mgnify:CR=1 FL=1
MDTLVRLLDWLYLWTKRGLTRWFYRGLPACNDWDVMLSPDGGEDVLHLIFVLEDAIDQFSETSLVMFKEDEEGYITLVNVGQRQMDVGRVKAQVFQRFLRLHADVYHVRVHLNMRDVPGNMRGELLSCVTVAKRMMGIQEPLVQTPEQLLNYLWRGV